MGLGYQGAFGAKGGQIGFNDWIKQRLEEQYAQERTQQQSFENQMREKEFASNEEYRKTQQDLVTEQRNQAARERMYTIGRQVGDAMPPGQRVMSTDAVAEPLGMMGLLRTTGATSQAPPQSIAALGDSGLPEEEPGTLAGAPSKARILTKLPSAVQQQRADDDRRADLQLQRQREQDQATEEYRDAMLAAQRNNRGTLTASGEGTVIDRLSKQWTAASKPARDLDRQLALMNEGMKAVERGDMAQGSQTVLVTFQKILDPPSVVRESEYMRSAAGQALLARVQGYVEQLRIGGAGISKGELAKFARLAHDAAAAQKSGYLQGVRARLGRTAQHFNIPEDLVFEDDGSADEEPAAKVDVPPPRNVGPRQIGERKRFDNGNLAEWNGTAWVRIRE
jgi:hypothetical protein